MAVLPDRCPTIRVVAMPADANPYGDIFGGWLMGQMDVAAGLVASRHAGGRAATVAVEAMAFHRPVLIGDELSIYATLAATGTTSMTIEVEGWRRARNADEAIRAMRARFVLVAIGADGRPRPVAAMASPPAEETGSDHG